MSLVCFGFLLWSFNTPLAKRDHLVLNLLDTYEAKTNDLKLKLRGPRAVPDDLAIIAIDDRSLEKLGEWPWSRKKLAKLIESAFASGAKVIGLDVIFPEHSNTEANKVIEELEKIEGLSPQSKKRVKSFAALKKEEQDHDGYLGKVFEKYSDKIVAGTAYSVPKFNYYPYQYPCFEWVYENDPEFEKLEAVGYNVIRLSSPDDSKKDKIFSAAFNHLKQELKNLETLEEKYNYCATWLEEDTKSLKSFLDEAGSLLPKESRVTDEVIKEMISSIRNWGRSSALSHVDHWLLNIPELHDQLTWLGFMNFEAGVDGVVREIPLLVKTGPFVLPSLSYALAIRHVGGDGAQYSRRINHKKPNEFALTSSEITKEGEIHKKINLNDQGKAQLNFLGPGYQFPHISAAEFLDSDADEIIVKQLVAGRLKEVRFKKEDFLKGKTLIIGATALGTYDLRVTPFDKNYAGVEAHLTALENIVNDQFFHPLDSSEIITLLIILVLGLILTVVLSISGSMVGFFTSLSSLLTLVLVDYFVFFKSNVLTPASILGLFIVLIYSTITLYRYFGEERKKKAIKGTFEKYVSPSIVQEVLAHPENLQLGGRKEFMSVFFSDIRGFTTISESLDPTDLSKLLNMYLTPMTQIVFKNKGTLDKYMGDAIMAFFGAPVNNESHAEDACRCALEQMMKLNELNAELAAQNLTTIDIGIGINTGEMSVGNMGSQTVRNYTVMGDAVNLGSRLEGINKNYGTHIIISEFTEKSLGSGFLRREIDWVQVKGKNEPVKIFELMGEGELHDEFQVSVNFYRQGYEAYRQQNFSEALKNFESAYANSNDSVSKMYMNRCHEFIKNPPPKDWDGVFIMKTK